MQFFQLSVVLVLIASVMADTCSPCSPRDKKCQLHAPFGKCGRAKCRQQCPRAGHKCTPDLEGYGEAYCG
ncbi:unnamed protein product [Zymoseptoria tritici ST99CH_1E4]|uniref:TNFR-Cys domain-containing protein n=1 Tax=Zymoseptoria tritici ST99CH_1E4 TaxID=1276532 RepID=A0A2H1GYA4_ZYMTR|nr:unnamed protein product [Zymoseptoria tritici ST99CH_1E4]